MTEKKINLYLNLFFSLILGLWITLSFTPMISPNEIISQLSAKYLYGLTCHQISDRCFGFDGISMLICSRCFGIYTGLIAGILLFSVSKIRSRFDGLMFSSQLIILILFAAPFCFDIILSKSAMYNSGNAIRFVTGFFLTIPFSFFIKSSLTNLSKEIYYKTNYAK
ncbi:MAG: DUF2085 domain-containing protein [Ignavibacteria bacterium]|nr:DUF2085 domain-containing protein [Ignavibacteria bacterium]